MGDNNNFPVRLSQPIITLSYNKENGWWEGNVHFGRIAVWLEIDKEQARAYVNCFTLTDAGELQSRYKWIFGFMFTELCGVIPWRFCRDSDRIYFDLESYCDLSCLENVNCLPVLLFSVIDKGPAWCIPDRPELFKVKEFKSTPESSSISEESKKKIKMFEEKMKQQAQEQKEQTEREWEEWEKRQAEENGDNK